MNWKVPLIKSSVSGDDIRAVTKVLKRGTFLACGPEIEEFENKVAEYLNQEGVRVLAFNSGTSALHTLLLAHDIKGKEVIVPSFTFIATANAVLLAGGIPVFADVERDTFGLDFESVKSKITKKTAAVIIVHIGGFPATDSYGIKNLCKEKGVLFLEDAAQSFGAGMYEPVGTIGDGAIFSLCQNKVLTTSEGGLLITKDEKIFEKAKLLRSQGRVEVSVDYFNNTGDNDYILPGYNLRMPSMNAAMGISQLKHVDEIVAKRKKIYDSFRNNLCYLVKFQRIRNYHGVYQMCMIRLDDKVTRDALQSYLTKVGVMTKTYFQPIHKKTLYAGKKVNLPVTEELADTVLTLPLYPDLKKSQVDYMIYHIIKFFNKKG
jgi:perosamine synthetase